MSYKFHTHREQLELAIGQGLDILAAVYCDMVRDYGTPDEVFRREVLEQFEHFASSAQRAPNEPPRHHR